LKISCIVLAGGKSKRLGRNKLLEPIGNKTLLERVLTILSPIGSKIIIVKGKESSLPGLEDYQNLKIVEDIFPEKGSLGGVYTGLTVSNDPYNLVVACDMPFLNSELLKYMIDLAEGFDAVVPRVNDELLEPLHAIYSRNCIPALDFLVAQNRLSILELYPMVKIKYLTEKEIQRFDPKHLSFFNINTEADLRAGMELDQKGEY